MNKAVNADWIKLMYMNQRDNDSLVVFKNNPVSLRPRLQPDNCKTKVCFLYLKGGIYA